MFADEPPIVSIFFGLPTVAEDNAEEFKHEWEMLQLRRELVEKAEHLYEYQTRCVHCKQAAKVRSDEKQMVQPKTRGSQVKEEVYEVTKFLIGRSKRALIGLVLDGFLALGRALSGLVEENSSTIHAVGIKHQI